MTRDVVASERVALFVEQRREPPRHVAEADQHRSRVIEHRRSAIRIRNRVAEALETRAQMLGLVAEAEAEVVVHAEVIAGHDQHAFLDTQPRDELGGVDRVMVAGVDDRAGVRRRVAERPACASSQPAMIG